MWRSTLPPQQKPHQRCETVTQLLLHHSSLITHPWVRIQKEAAVASQISAIKTNINLVLLCQIEDLTRGFKSHTLYFFESFSSTALCCTCNSMTDCNLPHPTRPHWPAISYLLHLFQIFLQVLNLVGFKSQGGKNKQEEHQHHQGRPCAHPQAATAPSLAPRPLVGLSIRPAGHQVGRRDGALHASAFVDNEHLRERVGLVVAHGASPVVRAVVCVHLSPLHEGGVFFNLIWETKLLTRH